MNLRELQPHELPALLDLYRHLQAGDASTPLDNARAAWAQTLTNPRMRLFGGFAADGLTLLASWSVTLTLNPADGQLHALVENVMTHPGHRDQPWGPALMAHAHAYAQSQGCGHVMLVTSREG